MVCFFETAFKNGLRFPLHPFIKNVLQHFNVCLSQLSPNFWGVLVGLLVIFKDKGHGVPSIALLLDFFSVKDVAEGFLYISKRTNAKLIISDFPLSLPRSRSDPIGESEPVSGCETICWDSYFILFYFKLNLYMWYTNNFCNNQQSFTFTNELPPEWDPLKFLHIY